MSSLGDGRQCTIQRLEPSRITPATPIARAIGLDRGELLTRYRAFVLADPPLAAALVGLVSRRPT